MDISLTLEDLVGPISSALITLGGKRQDIGRELELYAAEGNIDGVKAMLDAADAEATEYQRGAINSIRCLVRALIVS